LTPGTAAAKAYDRDLISERHRHRWEFNNHFRDLLSENGLVLSGQSPDGRLVEIAELADHPFMLGCQFHPEFKSRPNHPHPLFKAFMAASVRYQQKSELPLLWQAAVIPTTNGPVAQDPQTIDQASGGPFS
jgi:CTP synthase